MPVPGCQKCRSAIRAFKSDAEGGSGDPLEWAEDHLWRHDRRRKLYRAAALRGKEAA